MSLCHEMVYPLPPLRKKINSHLADVFLFRGMKNFHLLYTVVNSEFTDVLVMLNDTAVLLQ